VEAEQHAEIGGGAGAKGSVVVFRSGDEAEVNSESGPGAACVEADRRVDGHVPVVTSSLLLAVATISQ
jgi:hypothetical protein